MAHYDNGLPSCSQTNRFSVHGNWSEVLNQAPPRRIVRNFLASDSTQRDDAVTYDTCTHDRNSLNLAIAGPTLFSSKTAEEFMTELKHPLEIGERLHIVSCQILSAAVANILASLD